MDRYYVFYTKGSDNFYERTCGSKKAAEDRVKNLKKTHDNAEHFENEIPKGYKYFY